MIFYLRREINCLVVPEARNLAYNVIRATNTKDKIFLLLFVYFVLKNDYLLCEVINLKRSFKKISQKNNFVYYLNKQWKQIARTIGLRDSITTYHLHIRTSSIIHAFS